MRARAVSMLLCTGFIPLLVELGGIWKEVHQIRVEQVKNQCTPTKEVRERVRKLPKADQVKRNYESTSNVEVDGSVEIANQPIEVEINQ